MRCLITNLIYWLIVLSLSVGVYHETGVFTVIIVILFAGAIKLSRMVNNQDIIVSVIRHIAKLQDRVLELEKENFDTKR